MNVLKKLITLENVSELLKAIDGEYFTPSNGVYRRMGVNGLDNLSKYETLKYWRFSSPLRGVFKTHIPAVIREESNESWFLRFPEGGTLDQYRSRKRLFNILSIPLNDGGNFRVWDGGGPVDYKNVAGDGYFFNLGDFHQVVNTNQEDVYLCFILLNHIDDSFIVK